MLTLCCPVAVPQEGEEFRRALIRYAWEVLLVDLAATTQHSTAQCRSGVAHASSTTMAPTQCLL